MKRLVSMSAALAMAACAYPVTPRFSQEVASGFATDDMRRMETDDAEIYYPAKYRAEAERVAARATECLEHLRALTVTKRERRKALLFITSANFNNAYVSGMNSGEQLHSVVPLMLTDEIFNWYGLSNADTGDVACHEMFHYAHFDQVENVWSLVNTIVGDVMPSQVFLESWFTEGTAQYYEGRIARNVGRPSSPVYRAAFESFVALRKGKISAGDLNQGNRELYPYSGAYLTSLPFIEYLVERSGEDKLWELMDVQGRSFFTPFGVSLRFQQVYGRDLGALIDEWSLHLQQQYVAHERPAEQHVLRTEVGQMARLATHPASGTMALLTVGNEEPSRLRILEADGTVRVEKRLPRLDPGREWIFTGPGSMSGLSFTGDGKFLFLINDDLISRGDTRGQLWKIDAATGEVLRIWQDLGMALGGAVHPDGTAYTMIDVTPGHTALVDIDLATGAQTTVAEMEPGVAAAAPSWSPDGTQLAFSHFDANGWNLVIRNADHQLLTVIGDGAFNYAPHWDTNDTLVFSRTVNGHLQAHRYTVSTRQLEVLTAAPFAAIDSAAVKNSVAFINRDGTSWSLDVAPAKALSVITFEPPTEPVPPWPRSPKLKIESDEPVSAFDHLFVPQLRMPSLSAWLNGTTFVPTISLQLMGRDRLAKHTWSITGAYGPTFQTSTIAVEYLNQTLAPWSVSISGSRDAQASFDTTWKPPTEATWTGSVDLSRTFWVMPLSFGIQGLGLQTLGGATQKFFGPSFAASWAAGESTPYAGSIRRIALSVAVAGYGKFFGSDFDFMDLAASISGYVPLPFSTRHSLALGLRARAVAGGAGDALKIGGPTSSVLLQSGNEMTPTYSGQFLPGRLSESVRGYEDTGVRGTMMATATARYRYPFIIDRGFSSVLWILPSVFFRQVDLDIFGAATVSDSTSSRWLRAAGAQVTLRTFWVGAAPVSLGYQFAYRFDLNLPPLHSLMFTLD